MTRPQPALTPDAHADVLQAVRHYNEQRPLLGFEFLDEFEHSTELIRQAAAQQAVEADGRDSSPPLHPPCRPS